MTRVYTRLTLPK